MAQTLQEVQAQLESRGIMPQKAPTLEPTEWGLQKIGFFDSAFFKSLEQNPKKCVIVAGTNGKGSTAATLEALCIHAGERTGLYTSPHLEKITERIRIQGQDVSDDVFIESFEKVSADTKERHLSHFEMVTLIAIDLMCSGRTQAPVDRLILEVGLGGTWDSTNAIPHGLAVIAQLGFDHTNLLGKTLPEIAANKFGVISPGISVVHAPLPTEVLVLAETVRAQTGSRWRERECYRYSVKAGLEPEFFISTRWGDSKIHLPGNRGAANTALALTTLGHNPQSHLAALQQVRWPGRMERLSHPNSDTPIYLSGDHNTSGVESLLELLPHYTRRHLHVLAGVGRDKDFAEVLRPWTTMPHCSLYLTETPFKGLTLPEYGVWKEKSEGAWANPQQALSEVLKLAAPNDMILVTGSLYLVGTIRNSLIAATHLKTS